MKYNENSFKEEIKHLYKGEIEIVSHFKGLSLPILAQNKYGIMKISKASLLLQYIPGIKVALNKTEYFMNLLREAFPEIAEQLEPYSEYKTAQDKMIFNTKYGLISLTPDNLIHGHAPTIRSAVDRKTYFKNQLLYLYDNLYDFEINSTSRHEGRVTLICPKHGKQSVDSDTIFTGCGCPKCNSAFTPSDVFYLIKLSNHEESFYKLGISHFDKHKLVSRFKNYYNLGFNVEVINITQFKTALECKEFEEKLKKLIKPYLYKPLTWEYNTSKETFKDNLLETIINNINNIEYDIVSTSNENLSSLKDG